MTQRAIDWDVAPEGELTSDSEIRWPAVLPSPKVRAIRHVGVVKAYAPAKTYGLVEEATHRCDAIFSIDDVAPHDRGRLDCGQTVTFEMVEGPDGRLAKQIRIDLTTLPPPPDEAMMLRGWR